MLGDPRKAQEVFHATLREAAMRAARGELPSEPFCLEATKSDLQPEPVEMDERDVAPKAESQIQRLDPMQLAIWISAAPDPQRSALALFYLDEFDYREILDIAELKLSELSRFLAKGRRQLQAWLDSKFPQPSKV